MIPARWRAMWLRPCEKHKKINVGQSYEFLLQYILEKRGCRAVQKANESPRDAPEQKNFQ